MKGNLKKQQTMRIEIDMFCKLPIWFSIRLLNAAKTRTISIMHHFGVALVE